MVAIEAVTLLPESLEGPVDPRALFGNDSPVELEIGCGKGGFLLAQAKAHPERNYLGIEWANQFYRFAADRMARWGLGNVRIMRTDAKAFVIRQLADSCLAAMHVYHPDPWPKKRHHKRRLLTPDFVEAIVRVLEPGGRLFVQTDHAEYFEQIRAVTAARPELEPIPFESEDGGERTPTNYEIKYQREGRAIYRLAYRREKLS